MKFKSVLFLLLICSSSVFCQVKTEKWKIFELTLKGSVSGNPFTDVTLQGKFIQNTDTISVSGFYDGNGIYKIRFMPTKEGKWSYVTVSNTKKLDKKQGYLLCTPALKDNYGPVVVKDTFDFAYANGKPYYPFGTTCYGWAHQGDSLGDLTIKTLSNGYFNKMRMCIFPKNYDWNINEPQFYPFEGELPKKWDYTRFNPAFFRNIEKRIQQLDSLGIQADLIVFHPYDKWGFSSMDRKTDDMYIQYIVARLAAYKNVWWSMANEYDLIKDKTISDWNHYISFFAEKDPYHHLRSIHHCIKMYDHSNPLIHHVSIQGEDTYQSKDHRKKFRKPIIYDECRYEGNISWSWGSLTAQSMVEKFWRGVTNGGYVGHGETYLTENPIKLPSESSDVLWWSKGGILRGQSPERIKFLSSIIESAPAHLKPINIFSWMPYSCVGIEHEFYLAYLNDAQPRIIVIDLPKDAFYKIEVIDTWNMTITPLEKKFTGHSIIELPARPYTALRIRKS